MGTVHPDVGPSHLRGKIGDFIYKWYGRRMVVTRVPRRSKKKPTAKRRRANNVFREASDYAERARGSDIWREYEAAAKKRRVPTRCIAMHDYMATPQPGTLKVANSYGNAGDELDLVLMDKYGFKTTAVEVVISDAAGKRLAHGAAHGSGKPWRYVLPVRMPEGEELTFEIIARDRFGKVGRSVSQGRFKKIKWR